MKKEYKKPQGQFIGDGAEKLYKLEDKRNEAIKEAAIELAVILRHEKNMFYQHTMPEELLNILDSFDHKASELAAFAYLEKRGFLVMHNFDDKELK